MVTPHATPLVTPVAVDPPEEPDNPVKMTPKPLHPGVVTPPPGDPRAALAANKWKKWKPGQKPIVTAPITAPRPVAGPPVTGDTSSTEKAVPTVNVIMRTKAVPAILRCYPAGSAGPGKFSVDMTVGSDGKVTEANVEGAEEQAGCVLGILRSLHFAPPTDGDSYSFRYDFAGVRH